MLLICMVAAVQGFLQDKNRLLKEWGKIIKSKTDLYKGYNDLKFGMFLLNSFIQISKRGID
jgi:hypothetical protein